jgi:hypothetical protein
MDSPSGDHRNEQSQTRARAAGSRDQVPDSAVHAIGRNGHADAVHSGFTVGSVSFDPAEIAKETATPQLVPGLGPGVGLQRDRGSLRCRQRIRPRPRRKRPRGFARLELWRKRRMSLVSGAPGCFLPGVPGGVDVREAGSARACEHRPKPGRVWLTAGLPCTWRRPGSRHPYQQSGGNRHPRWRTAETPGASQTLHTSGVLILRKPLQVVIAPAPKSRILRTSVLRATAGYGTACEHSP